MAKKVIMKFISLQGYIEEWMFSLNWYAMNERVKRWFG